jgi:hypothetical protein
MDLSDILKYFQRKYRNNEIIYVISLLISVFLFLLLLIVGLFINRLILLIFVPVIAIILYKSKVFISLISISHEIESYFPEIKNKLIPSIELYKKFRNTHNTVKEGYSPELIDAAILRTTESIKKFPLHSIINYKNTPINFNLFSFIIYIYSNSDLKPQLFLYSMEFSISTSKLTNKN